jgi:hypothetical protein
MDGLLNKNEVICCFCGKSLSITKAVVLNIQPNIQSDEFQSLFCHKYHLVELINKSTPLHPDLFKDDEDSEK